MKYILQLALIVLMSSGLGMLSAEAADNNAAGSFTPAQQSEIEQVVHDYLLQNPQLLVEVSQELEASQHQQAEQQAQQVIRANSKQIFADGVTPALGNPKGSMVLVEFLDYQCHYCRGMNPIVTQLLKNNNDLRIIFKQLPIFGPNSQFAAKAVLAAQTQGKYLALHNALMSSQGPLSTASILQMATSVGINTQQLQKDLEQPQYQQLLADNFKLANALGVAGTPYFIVAKLGQSNNATPTVDAASIIFDAGNPDALQTTINQLRKGQ